MKDEKAKVKENKDQPRKVSSCFEGQACAELMQKILAEKRIGSLCEEMMRSLIEECRAVKEKPREAQKREAKEQKDVQGSKSAQSENTDKNNGGVK